MMEVYPMESVYNLLACEEERHFKPFRYVSTFKESVKYESKKNKTAHKTMGPAKLDVPSPKEYLLKHSKEPKLPERKSTEKEDNLEKSIEKEDNRPKKPFVPKRTDQPIMGVLTKKNFIRSNAAEAIMEVAKKPQLIFVDSKRGDKHPLESSGLVPKYINKKDYGENPKYLTRKKEEAKRAQEEYDAYVKERLREGAMKQLSEEERESVLLGLKKNWDEVHHEYQGLSVVIDTLPKKMHKERLETEMKQLERDIQLIERHKIIYIANK
ncbi:enkurin [Microcaecilia unicolor]|uniref:Enkurin n=1 Tax=Microcaecilia unicolor TaxID=1415580 RepID=A0A6P7XXG2_9AMPH|nr:enkurin [Microcaecilia unicolor]